MSKIIFSSFIILLCVSSVVSVNAENNLTLNCQTRDASTGEIRVTPTGIDPSRTAVIIIDMWNSHWCMTASERVSAMVPRMNQALDIARRLGMKIVWNPSDVVTAYSGYPQYEKAIAAQERKAPRWRDALTVRFNAPYGKCMCGPGIHCHVNYGWDAMHPDLHIGEDDLISASTDEIYSLLSEYGITHIIYMGVHTNMCVFGKPGALSSMWSAGFDCLLARDLNDAYTAYEPERGYTPDTGTTEINDQLQKAGIPGVNLGEDFRKANLWDPNTAVDYVRFVPWGKPQRPYLMEQSTTITLSAPWLDGAEIRYTTDGSVPTAQSALYAGPLEIAETTTLRALAFRRGKPVSLPSMSYYVKMAPSLPPLPDVYLEDLNYIPNAYLKSVSSCLWYPRKWSSFEGKPLRIRGKTYAHGMGFRAPSSVQYEIKPEYKRFVARAGVDDNMLEEHNARAIGIHSSVIFCVYIDGVKMAESPVMRLSQEPWRFDVEIPANSRRINLSCMDADSRSPLDYGNWVDAGFINSE
jgi:nicotinamidase-related amidase